MSTLKTNNIQHVDRSDPSIIINTDGGVSIAGTLTYEDVTSVDAVGIVTAREILNAQKQVHVGTGVSVKAGGINVTAGITTVQALQATTGTFSSTGAFSDNVSIVKAGGPVLELCNNTNTTTMALRLHEGTAGSLVNGGGMIYDGASNKLHITCGTNLRTERVTVDRDTGNVGVGLTSPEGLFHTRTSSGTNRNHIEASASHAFLRLKGGSTSYNSGLEFYSGSSNIANLTGLGAGGIAFEVGGGERFRITSGGKLLVGSQGAAHQVAGGDSMVQVQATDSTGRISVVQHRNEAEGAPYISLGKTRGTSNGAVTVVQSGDTLGTIAFAGGDGTDIQSSAAHIVCQVDGAPGSNDMPGRLLFKTTADGNASTTTRLTINQAGNSQFTGIVTATQFVPSSDSVTLGGMRNMVINGDFQIDQRNSGAELSITGNTLFSADRWTSNNDGFTYYKTQRKDDASIADIGTSYYMRVTVTTAVTLGGSASQVLENNLEGNTCKQLNLGTSAAKQCTISFFVRSSLTGLFGGALQNVNYDRCHPFSYTINSANTWEYKTFTFTTTGFTTGSFNTGDGVGLRLVFSLGNGSNRQASPDQWHSSVKMGPTGETNLVATNGATLDIAKVQLEVGTQATPFEDISYAQELTLCQRYYEGVYMSDGTALMKGYASYGGSANFEYQFKVQKRAIPTWSLEGNASWAGATPNAYESQGSAIFQHNGGTLFALSDGSGDLCGSFSAEL